MSNPVCWLLPIIASMSVVIDGKLDGQHIDKQISRDSSNITVEHRQKSLPEHGDLFGAKMYRTLFKVKHREQLDAVKKLMMIVNEKKQEKLLLELVDSIMKVIDNAKMVIEKANFKPNDTFPSEDKNELRNAIANVIENTVLYSNLILHFPITLHNRYKKDIDWQLLFTWAYKFTTEARLHDDAAEKLLDLAGQQLDITPKKDDFYNPYDKKAMKEAMELEALQKREEALKRKQDEKKLERKKKKKPSLSRTEL